MPGRLGAAVSGKASKAVLLTRGLAPERAAMQLLSRLSGAAPNREEPLTAMIQEAYIHGVSAR
jgi:hypothetical protein